PTRPAPGAGRRRRARRWRFGSFTGSLWALDVDVAPGTQRRRRTVGARLILRRALGADLARLEAALGERALDHDLGAVLERVGHGAGVADLDLLAAVDGHELVLDGLVLL